MLHPTFGGADETLAGGRESMSTRRRLLGAAAGLGAVGGSMGLAACGGAGGESGAGGGGASGDKSPLTVGATVSSTGGSAKIGQAQKEGYELWAEQVSQRNGLLGRPVRLNILDDASDPAA